MGVAVFVIFYGSILFCLIMSGIRIWRYIKIPLHLRWEVYHGSSIYEQQDSWTRTNAGLKGKLGQAASDILLLKGYYRHNRSFWWVLFPFHLGLYLLFIWHCWIFVVPLIIGTGAADYWSLILGHTGTVLVLFGGLGILISRLTTPKLRAYYPAIHYFKWIFVLVTLVGGFYAVYMHFNNDMTSVTLYVGSQLAFQLEHKLNPPLLMSLHVLIISFWLIYLPFSHIMRLFLRYYHVFRWDYVPNRKGSAVEQHVTKLLGKPVIWSAGHIQTGKTWREVIRELP